MNLPGLNGIDKHALTNMLKRQEYSGYLNREHVVETWYQLSPDNARRFINEQTEWLEQTLQRTHNHPEAWIKLMTLEYTEIMTGKKRWSWTVSLRPYIQGYGCDGTTDLNIHAIANKLAEQYRIDYPTLLKQSYPTDYSGTDDFHWLNDKIVLAETFIPPQIDADLALQDLQEINHYTLAENFGVELYRIGAIAMNWQHIKENRVLLEERITHDVSTTGLPNSVYFKGY